MLKRLTVPASLEEQELVRAIRLCGDTKNLQLGRQTHSILKNSGPELGGSRYIANLLVQMYGKCGQPEEARRVFDSIAFKNQYSWNLMLAAYAQNGHSCQAKALFDASRFRSIVTWTSILQAYVLAGYPDRALALFERMPQRDVISWNAMLAVYAQEGHLEKAKEMFDSMPQLSAATWNTMIASYSRRGYLQNARVMFDKMPSRDIVSWSSVVEAYAQRGHIESTKQLFDDMPETNVISWTAMLSAYAQGGLAKETMELFARMNLEGVQMDEIAFINVLVGCSHTGTVEVSRDYFLSMVGDFGLQPLDRHYCCIVDVLGRTGKLQNAEDLIHSMPLIPNDIHWRSLLNACRIYGDVVRSARVAKELSKLDPDCSSVYFLVRDLYADDETGGLSSEMEWNGGHIL